MRITNRNISYLVLIVIVISLVSCNDAKDSKTQLNYKSFSLNHQEWKSKSITQFIGDINYTATEVPLQYYLLKNNLDNPQFIDSLSNLYEKERVIEIEFQHANETDLLLNEYTKRSYEEAVKYMAFTIEKDFTVVTSSNDTIQCAGVNFERNFKIAPFKRVLLYFNNINPKDHIKLMYQDHLFGNGIIKFDLNKTPLKL